MMTVTKVLIVAALITVIMSATGYAPLWVSVLLLCVIELIRVFPLGK